LLTGAGSFADDRMIPGALHVAFRRSDLPHARIVSIDCSAARSLRGVAAVFTGDDLKTWSSRSSRTSRMKNYPRDADQPFGARVRSRYVGEPIVAVLAENRYLRGGTRSSWSRSAVVSRSGDVGHPSRAPCQCPAAARGAGTNVPGPFSREFARRATSTREWRVPPIKVGGRFRFRRKTPVAMEPRTYVASMIAALGNFLTLTS